MFGLEYLMAFVKLFIQLAFAIVSSIIFKPAWNCVASNYLSEWLPEQFLHIPYWHFVAIILTCSFLGEQISKLTPKIVSVSNDNNVNT
jgi:hypothetical protein